MPKKRGPKTDVLEALLKRVAGLEKFIQSDTRCESLPNQDSAASQDTASETKSIHGAMSVSSASLASAAPPVEVAPEAVAFFQPVHGPAEIQVLEAI